MVKQYRVVTPGVSHGLKVALALRVQMDQALSEFLLHGIIYFIEKWAQHPDAPNTVPLPWPDLILAAATKVHAEMQAGLWFYPNLQLGVEIHRRRVILMTVGANLWTRDTLIEPFLSNSSEVSELVEEVDFYGANYRKIFAVSGVVLDILDPLRLSDLLSQQAAWLESTGNTYTLAPTFRRNKKLIEILNGSNDEKPIE